MSEAPRRQGGGRQIPPSARGAAHPTRPRYEPVDREKTCPLLLRVFTKVKEVSQVARRRDARLSFAFVYPDKNGRFVVREVGQTFSYGSGKRLDDSKTLAELGFEIGDYLDVAINQETKFLWLNLRLDFSSLVGVTCERENSV